MVDWLQKRRDREEKRTECKEKEDGPAPASDNQKARERRTEQRNKNVQDGLDRLDLWLKDLVRSGLADLAGKPASFWEEQAKRLVDAQAPGLAGRVARLALLPPSSADAVERLLGELGRIKLLLHAYGRIDQIEPALASEIRQILGWNVSQDALEREGQRVQDNWIVAGQWDDDGERIATRRSWIIGRRTGRIALVLLFSVGGQPYGESMVPGTEQEGTLLFYPGASLQRAKFVSRDGIPARLVDRPPGHETLDHFLSGVSESLAQQPWLSAFGGVLHDVTLARSRDAWWVCDKHAQALPVLGQDHWNALAVTGCRPADLAVEWDGYQLRLLGGLVAGRYWSF